MADYLVLTAKGRPEADPEAVFIRDGFSWLGFVLPPLYFFWHRQFLLGFITLVAVIAISLLAATADNAFLTAALNLAMSLFFGLEGGTLRISAMQKRGYRLNAVISAANLEQAERVYYAAAQSGDIQAQQQKVLSMPVLADNKGATLTGGPVFGMFDSYGRR